MKVVLVHDWLTGMRGGEKCLEAFLSLYPEADIFTLIHVPGTTSEAIDRRVVQTSFLNRIPFIAKYYRLLLPLFPAAIRQFDLAGYDLVITLSHAAAKNVAVPPGIPHICYCFTPMRYIWDQASEYFGRATPLLWPLIRSLRTWDLKGAHSVTEFVSISRFIGSRIRRYYKRRASVIYPPVDTSWIRPCSPAEKGAAFLYAGALVPYKRVDRIVAAFNELGEELRIVGTGPEERKLRRMAKPNVKFTGRVSDTALAAEYRDCRALLFAGTEDFGMVPVECMAAGRPVIGHYAGGLVETCRSVKFWEGREEQIIPAESTGVFFLDSPGGRSRPDSNDKPAGLIEAVRYFIQHEGEFSPEVIMNHAKLFSPEVFRQRWFALLSRLEANRFGKSDETHQASIEYFDNRKSS